MYVLNVAEWRNNMTDLWGNEMDKCPCDIPDENGEYRCPYADTYTGYESEMCRNMCGLSVDE